MRTTCCICSDILDEITPNSAAPCGHVFHSNCLNVWINQSGTCPVCRKRANHKNILKLYFTLPTSSAVENPSVLENEILNLKAELSAKNVELEKCTKQKDDTAAFVRQAERMAAELQQTVYRNETEISKLRQSVKSLRRLEMNNMKLEQMNSALTNDLQHLNNVQLIVNGTQKDVDNIIRECGNGSDTTRQMSTYCTVLKRELQKVIESKNKLLEQNTKLKQENCRYAAKVKFCDEAMAINSKSQESLRNQSSTFTIKKFSNKQDNMNNSPITSKLLASTSQTEVDISPLSVPFNKSKFNMKIVQSSNTTCKIIESNVEMHSGVTLLNAPNCNDKSSVIRTGYNGLGGHSNFINTSSSIKKFKTLKRKI